MVFFVMFCFVFCFVFFFRITDVLGRVSEDKNAEKSLLVRVPV